MRLLALLAALRSAQALSPTASPSASGTSSASAASSPSARPTASSSVSPSPSNWASAGGPPLILTLSKTNANQTNYTTATIGDLDKFPNSLNIGQVAALASGPLVAGALNSGDNLLFGAQCTYSDIYSSLYDCPISVNGHQAATAATVSKDNLASAHFFSYALSQLPTLVVVYPRCSSSTTASRTNLVLAQIVNVSSGAQVWNATVPANTITSNYSSSTCTPIVWNVTQLMLPPSATPSPSLSPSQTPSVSSSPSLTSSVTPTISVSATPTPSSSL